MACVVCGKKDVSFRYVWEAFGYMERGISKKHFICPACYDKKTIVRNYSGDEKKRAVATSYLTSKIANKSVEVQNVVNAWINGEEHNYFASAGIPVYYVEGPRASLFVFENHISILSSFQPLSDNSAPLDYVFFYKYEAMVSAKKKQEVKSVLRQYSKRDNLSDFEKIQAKLSAENISNWKQKKIELNISMGGYGTLDFGKVEGTLNTEGYFFQFYYHQNQLMEEIYNYIQNRITNSDASSTDVPVINNEHIISTKSEEISAKESGTSFSAADEIRKMKELFDCGIISQEEFDEAKKRLISKL